VLSFEKLCSKCCKKKKIKFDFCLSMLKASIYQFDLLIHFISNNIRFFYACLRLIDNVLKRTTKIYLKMLIENSFVHHTTIDQIMFITTILLIALLCNNALAGPVTTAGCYTACNAGVVTCYSLAGLTFGVATGPVGWWAFFSGGGSAAAAACSAVQGVCMAACTTTIVAPTP
jgi:hypothetical protein